MANNVEIELIDSGIQELLKSDEIKSYCEELANGVRDRAGDGFEVNTHVGKTRANAMVYADTKEAISRNYKENTLLKALGG